MEARVIARAFHLPTKFNKGVAEGPGVRVVVVGPRGGNLDLVRGMPAQGLIMAGLGGALAPELRVGDVVVQGDVPAVVPGLSHRVLVGPIATTEEIVATPKRKAELFERTGALAVDMETQAAKFLADSLQIPFLAVRAISDTAAEGLSEYLLTLVYAEGNVRVGRALGLLARRPWRVREMLALRRAAKVALGNLAATVEAIVRAGWPRCSTHLLGLSRSISR